MNYMPLDGKNQSISQKVRPKLKNKKINQQEVRKECLMFLSDLIITYIKIIL